MHECMPTCGADELVVQAIGFMYRNYKVLVSLDAKEDVVGESPLLSNVCCSSAHCTCGTA